MADLTVNVALTPGSTYLLAFYASGLSGVDVTAEIEVYQGTQLILSMPTDNPSFGSFFTADGSGNFIKFSTVGTMLTATIDGVSLRVVTQAEISNDPVVKTFLEGQTDDGQQIFFRADTQPIQLSKQFETFSNPLAIVSRVQRGTLLKCFVAIDDGDFYELEGTVSKGVSIMKVHAQGRRKTPVPPIARKIRVSWRDGSKQLCRLIQGAIVFTPGTMDYSE